MATRKNKSSNRAHTRSRGGRGSSKSGKLKIIIPIIVGLGLIGLLIAVLSKRSGYQFQRLHLDKYVAMNESVHLLKDGASVYIDMSNGMNNVYCDPKSKEMLQAVINKFADNNSVEFFRLADGKIDPLHYSLAQLYNYMSDKNNYNKQKAPIEETLSMIVEKDQPALLLTDFEEFKGQVIDKGAYAKRAFTDWLAGGNNITFYKWPFTESGKQKLMFMAVFDDNANRLASMVRDAVDVTNPNLEKYVLGGRNFAYPTLTQYISLKQGGNYHNSKGQDAVTNVLETGSSEAYISYARPYATAEGVRGQYAPLDQSLGAFAEYYPIGVTWADAVKNSKGMQEEGIPEEELYTHFLSRLNIDFEAQDGFKIDGVEVRVFNMQATIEAMNDSVTNTTLESIHKPEVNTFLTASMEPNKDNRRYTGISIDFDERFDGAFAGGTKPEDLFKATIVISRVAIAIDKTREFFTWDGNPSIANSVIETLQADTSNPIGRILYTYYLKTI